jgi:deoxycytidine triphosphate deaminase
MTVLCNRQIEELISIEPFQKNASRVGTVSRGIFSYGYDVRVGTKFKIFTNATSGGVAVIDPKNEGIAQPIFLKASQVCNVRYADNNGKYQDQEGLTLPMVDT